MGGKNKKKPRPNATSDQPAFVVLKGRQFAVREPSGMRLMLFARTAEQMETDDLKAMGEVYEILEDVIIPKDWDRFVKHALQSRASIDEVAKVFWDAIEALSGRPTQRPADSSSGPQTTSESSTDGSSLRVIDREIEKGRPDLAYAIWDAQRQRAQTREGLQAV